jgi:hypothetical protein
MAAIHQSIGLKFKGLSSGEWATIDVDLEHDEATAAAALVAAIGAAAVSSPPPANIIVPAVCADRAQEIVSKNGDAGVHITIECPVAAVGSWEVKSISSRSKPAPSGGGTPARQQPTQTPTPGKSGAGGNGPKHNH